MASTAEEDWSIISSSDYEDDVGSSQSSARIESINEFSDNGDDELAAASVSTVRPDSKQGQSFSSKIRVTARPQPPALAQCGDLGLGLGGADGGVRMAPEAPRNPVLAPIVASYSAAREAAKCVQHGLRRTDTAIKNRSRQIFNRPLAQWRLHLDEKIRVQTETQSDSKFSSKLDAISNAVLGRLEAWQHILLYFVILTFAAGFTGTICGISSAINDVFSQHVGSYFCASSSATKPGSSQFAARAINAEDFKVWVHRSASWFTGLKAKCSSKAWSLINVVLYEDNCEKSKSWFGLGKIFHHKQARQLRVSRFWTQFNGHLHRGWRSIQDIHTNKFAVSIDQLSQAWASWISGIKGSEILSHVHARMDQLQSAVVILSHKYLRNYEYLAVKWWQDFNKIAQPALRTTATKLNASFDSVKTWYFSGGPANLTETLKCESKKLGVQLGNDLVWISSKTSQLSDSVSHIASECHTRVDTIEKREHLFNTVKATSKKGFELFNRRLQLAALDAYNLSKSVAAQVRR